MNYIFILLIFFLLFINQPSNSSPIKNEYHNNPNIEEEKKEDSFISKDKHADTLDRLKKLKTALQNYQADIGRIPYTAKDMKKKSAYNQELLLNSSDPEKNVLVCPDNQYMEIRNYEKKWRGPYIDGKPSHFMLDAWGTEIKYVAGNKSVYLWSYGPNKEPDCEDVDEAFKKQDTGEIDDIVITVGRFKRSFEN